MSKLDCVTLLVAGVLVWLLAIFAVDKMLTLYPSTSHTVGPEVILNNRISYVPLTDGIWIIKDEFSGEEYLAVGRAGLVKLERRVER